MVTSALLACALGACEPPTAPPDAAAPDASVVAYDPACDNVDPSLCMLPWPSSFFSSPDPETVTGWRVTIPSEAMPRDRRGQPLDPAPYARADGFSPATSMMISFPGELDPSLLAGADRIAASLEGDATTIVLDAETGERVAHFAELDEWPATDPARAPLYLRPAARLRPGAHYVVGIRGLRHRDGSPVEASAFFRALRDATPLPGADLETRRASMEETFAVLDAAGVRRQDLIAAWSFRTASDASLTADLLAMRDAALLDLGERGLGCTVTEVQDASEGATLPAGVWRRVQGTFTMPSFLVGPAPDDAAQARILRDGDGAPTMSGRVEAPFVLFIPESVRARVSAGGELGRLVIYGHGILGSRFEIDSAWMLRTAERLGLVVVATDWWGMSRDDLARLASSLSSDFDDFDSTPQRLHQGILNALGLMRAFRGACADLDALAVPLDAGGSARPYDPAEASFYGNSLGAILGGALAGVATDTDRFALGVGGGAWSMLITRSDAWRSFGSLLASSLDDPLTRSLLIVMSQALWDPVDAATYAPHLTRDPLAGTPLKRVLMQIGVGDVAVSNETAFFFARSAGVPLLIPSVSEPYGIAQSAGPTSSGLTIFGLPGVQPIPPGTRDPGPDTPTHNGVRSIDAALTQLDAFLRPDGEVIQPCEGPCDPD